MLIRATIVLLVVLNLGVAAWWLWHDAPVATPAWQAAGVPRLQLLGEVPQAASPPPARPRAAPTPTRTPARAAATTTACTGAEAGAAGWRVDLPPLASAAEAEATAARIAAAGFADYLVLREGGQANAIALGRYGTREAAQRRMAALQAAGFAARCDRIEAETNVPA